uniref:GAF domain-containing protein n=1 Tax=Globisporangium ultimum (strain ATCC 200006 / CBS 805.95 / DAOM BR144) TaxID=431595 RepID=K3WQX0_GLOUD
MSSLLRQSSSRCAKQSSEASSKQAKTSKKLRSSTSTTSSVTDTSDTNSSSSGFAGDKSSRAMLKVYVSDQELRTRGQEVNTQLDFDSLTNLSLSKWVWKEYRKEFTLFTADTNATGNNRQPPEVLAAGDINCSIEEVISLLCSVSEADYNASMKALHKNQFIYGSLVHTVPLPHEQDPEKPAVTPPINNYVAVKTGTFVRSSVFSRNEEWCFLETFERSPNGDSIVLSQRSMNASEIGTGRATHTRVDQLCDISTAFIVERIPRTRSVRLVFHGKFDGDLRRESSKGTATVKMTKARLLTLAKGVARIPEVVRRRRLGFQKLADHAAFPAKNMRCICCTKSLHFSLKKKRCHLCAYNVCDKCCSQEKMETYGGRTTSVLMCTRCLECVDCCDYSGISMQSDRKIRVKLEYCRKEDTSNDQSDDKCAESPGKALFDLMESALADTDETRRMAAMEMIKLILDESKSRGKLGLNHKSVIKAQQEEKRQCFTIFENETSGGMSEWPRLQALKKVFEHDAAHLIPIEDCMLANAESRNYTIHIPEDPATIVPDYPVPDAEVQRLRALQEGDYVNLGEIAELNLICELAAKEMSCAISQVTVVEQDTEFILACTMKELHRIRMPRNQTFCSHLIMDDKPFLLLHPEADVRFFNYDAVAKSGIGFYCGFPIKLQDGTVIGSVCCLDFQTRELTQGQYSTMTKLAQTAAKVLQARRDAVRNMR